MHESTEHTDTIEQTETSSEDISSNSSSDEKYTEGDILRLVRVRFPGHAHSHPFVIGKRHFAYGQKVVAMSERGMAVGYINSFPYEKEFSKSLLPLKHISHQATEEDVSKARGSDAQEQEAEEICKRLIARHNLAMELTHVEQTQYGKKTVFYFVAPQRVDFRELVKDLVKELKTRIELRQISVRDRAAALGGIGPCGRSLCCSTFLNKFGQVNIKMAKNQNLTLNPARLNGLCGQLKCCTAYEETVYTHKRKSLPKEGLFLKTKNGDNGKVTKLHIIKEQFDMITDQGVIKRYVAEQFSEGTPLDKNYKFPERFQHVTNETSQVIGLKESSKPIDEQSMESHQKSAHNEDDDLDDEFVSEFKNLDKEFKKTRYTEKNNASFYASEHAGQKLKDEAKKGSKNSNKKRQNRRRRNNNRKGPKPS